MPAPRALPRVTPRSYRRASAGALILLTVIVVSGAAVRLTGSGLGCTDWPNCEQGRLVAPLEFHPMVEFANRVFTGAVVISIVVAVLGSLLLVPRRRDLTWLSLGLVAGVIGQIVLGGITVLFELHPALVAGHFLLSMVLVTNAVVLHWRAAHPAGPTEPAAGPDDRRLIDLLVGVAAVVLVTGTVVTGTGPHGGDEQARRFAFEMPDVARVHGIAVVVLVALTAAVALRLRRNQAAPATIRAAAVLLAVEVAQAAVGYTQYFTGVPALLVAIHVAGATAVWIFALRLRLSTWAPAPQTAPAEAVLVPA